MPKLVLTVLVALPSFALAGCERATAGGAPAGTSPSAVSGPSAASAPAVTATGTALAPPPVAAPSAAPESGEPIPTIDAKLPVEKLDLAAFSKTSKEDKAKLIGKKLRLKGAVHSVSYNAMLFDARRALHGPVKEGAVNAVYAVELHGAKAPGETWSKQVASCFVDAKTQQELLADFKDSGVDVEVEGIVEATFNDLAPCRVVSKKVGKK
ncbi:MAG: hypothetical protein IPM35_23400 [Myxococcales bacterium]|nr:hypothetical protein [Myxococcales bacterium]